MIFDPSSPFLISTSIFFSFLKGLFLLGFGVYIVFAFAIIRQTALMTRSVQTGLNSSLRLFSIFHFIVATILWVIAFFVLQMPDKNRAIIDPCIPALRQWLAFIYLVFLSEPNWNRKVILQAKESQVFMSFPLLLLVLFSLFLGYL